jgi:F0F1-type ATP synthase assembly protein I
MAVRKVNKKSRISDRWIPAGVIAGVGLGMLVFGFTYNPFAIPGITLLGLGLGFAFSIVFRREEREE